MAEDAAGEAYAEASRRWPREGVPERPGAWLTTVARNRVLDRLRRLRWGWELVFLVLSIAPAYPLWLVDHPPIQDLPQHLAAIRVLVDHGDAATRFSDFFIVDLARTQYLAYYLAAELLSFALGIKTANLVLLTLAIVGAPYAMRALLLQLLLVSLESFASLMSLDWANAWVARLALNISTSTLHINLVLFIIFPLACCNC